MKGFMPPSIENDPTFKQFHARAVPLGSPNNVDWSQCGLAKVPNRQRAARKARGAEEFNFAVGDAP